jgi:hypothetical protein
VRERRGALTAYDRRRLLDEFVVLESLDHEQREAGAGGTLAVTTVRRSVLSPYHRRP